MCLDKFGCSFWKTRETYITTSYLLPKLILDLHEKTGLTGTDSMGSKIQTTSQQKPGERNDI